MKVLGESARVLDVSVRSREDLTNRARRQVLGALWFGGHRFWQAAEVAIAATAGALTLGASLTALTGITAAIPGPQEKYVVAVVAALAGAGLGYAFSKRRED